MNMNIHLETGSVSDYGELNELDVLRDKVMMKKLVIGDEFDD